MEVNKQHFLQVFQGSGIWKMEVNKQDFLQVFQGSGIEKMGGYFNECQPAF